MSIDLSNPERHTLLFHPSQEQPTHINKLFNDPDFIQLYLGDKRTFEISWASGSDIPGSVEILEELIAQGDFSKGMVALRRTTDEIDAGMSGANQLEGEAEDILNEVVRSEDRVLGYRLMSRHVQLAFRPTWPKTHHDIPTNELVLQMKRTNKMARYITDQAISLSAMDGLRESTDQTLDELSEYLPALRK